MMQFSRPCFLYCRIPLFAGLEMTKWVGVGGETILKSEYVQDPLKNNHPPPRQSPATQEQLA